MQNQESIEEIEEVLIQVGLRIARRGEGALMVVGKVDYEPLVDQTVPEFKIVDNYCSYCYDPYRQIGRFW